MSTTSQNGLVNLAPVSKDIPLTAPKSIWSLAPLSIGFTLYAGTLLAGGLVSPAIQFWPDLIGLIVVGNLILGSYAAALSYIAAKTGLSTVLMARFSFGNVGSRWIDFIVGFTQIGWYVWGSALIADLLNKLVGVPSDLHWLTILICTYLFGAIAYISYRWLDWLSRLVFPTMLFFIFWSLIIAMSQVGGFSGWLLIAPAKPLELGDALTIIIGIFISSATQVNNWNRFPITGREAAITILAVLVFVNAFFIFYSAIDSLLKIDVDIVDLIVPQGLLIWGLLLLLLNMLTSQNNTIHAFSVAAINIFGGKKRSAFVLLGVTLAFALAWNSISGMLVSYLIFMATFIPPIGGILMSDYWLYRKGKFPPLNEARSLFNWAGIMAYLGASAIGYFWPGIKPLNGILAAIVIYFLLGKLISFISRRLKPA